MLFDANTNIFKHYFFLGKNCQTNFSRRIQTAAIHTLIHIWRSNFTSTKKRLYLSRRNSFYRFSLRVQFIRTSLFQIWSAGILKQSYCKNYNKELEDQFDRRIVPELGFRHDNNVYVYSILENCKNV